MTARSAGDRKEGAQARLFQVPLFWPDGITQADSTVRVWSEPGTVATLPATDLAGELWKDQGAEVVATGNPGCWLQIRGGLDGRGIEVLHPVELLDRAYGA